MMTSFHLRNWCGHLRHLHFRDNILMTTMPRNIISTILMSDFNSFLQPVAISLRCAFIIVFCTPSAVLCLVRSLQFSVFSPQSAVRNLRFIS